MRIQIDGLKKSFKKELVLDIEHLEINHGLNCVMGVNGCGKSTLMNILAGQLPYEFGKVVYDGQNYTKKLASHMTLVHQKPYLFDRSVYENIAYPLKVRGLAPSVIKEKVEMMLEELKIEVLRDKNGTELSGGETQKVAIARAMVFEPKLLMLDESTSNIDSNSITEIESLIRNYSNQERTLIFVTHDECQARRMTESIIRL